MSKKRNYLFLSITALIFSSCGPEEKKAEEPPVPKEVTAGLTTISSRSPFKDDLALMRIINQSMEQTALIKGDDSVTLVGLKDSNGVVHPPPKFDDLYYFPETSDSGLVNVFKQAATFNLNRDTAFSHNIDFTREFAFVVSHPPVMEKNIYMNSVMVKDSTGGTLLLSLSYFPIPDNDAIVGAYWQTAVYKFQRGNYKTLAVVYKADTTFFPLQNQPE